MQIEWTDFWKKLLDDNKLNNKVREIDSVSKVSLEEICHNIYNKYSFERLNEVREELIREVEKFPGVHLNTSRVKSIESVLKKIITKKYNWMMDSGSRYSGLSDDNYDRIITDLVGIRFILSYRGNWKDLHAALVERFPYVEGVDYLDDILIPIRDDEEFIAEIPRAYYAYGDDISVYKNERVKPVLRESGYRSVHYIICFKGTYVEIQVRTIYDEAWSDCDHNYVYKHEENASHSALLELSKVLCQYTNTCNELGELIRLVFNNEGVIEKDKMYLTSKETVAQIDYLVNRYSEAQNLLMQFKDNLCVKGDQDDE